MTQSYIYDNELYICREYYSNQLDPEELRQQLLKIDSYVSQPLVKQILAKGVDSYTPSQLAVNLELLGLRDFSISC